MDLMNFDDLISLHYSLLENTETIQRNDGAGNGDIGTTTYEETSLPHQTSVKVEMADLLLDPCINDEEFYQQSGTGLKDPSNRLGNEKEMVMPTDSCGDAGLVPSVGAASFPVETLSELRIPHLDHESMLLDPMFSEMDVSSLIELNEAEESTNYHHDSSLSEIVPRTIRRRGGKGIFIEIDGNLDDGGNASATGEVRRSNRRRSLTEVFKMEVPSVPKIKRRRSIKLNVRKKLPVKGRPKKGRPPKATKTPPAQQIAKAPPPEELPEPEMEEMEEEEENNGLKIILRRYAPVNPLKHRIGRQTYRKGLIRGREHISAQLYFARAIEPRSLPYSCIFPESDGTEHFGQTQVAGDIPKVEETMRMEWITNYNIICNYRAHGQKILDEAEKEITPDGNALKGTIPLLNIDELYDDLLDIQEPFAQEPESVLKLDDGDNDNPLASTSTAISELQSSFTNEFNLSNDYFPDNNHSHLGEWGGSNLNEIIGATLINMKDLNPTCDYTSEQTVFSYKNKFYKVNHPVVIVVRTPDELIESMKAPVQKVTFASPFYSALTSYFDKKEEEKANAQSS